MSLARADLWRLVYFSRGGRDAYRAALKQLIGADDEPIGAQGGGAGMPPPAEPPGGDTEALR